MPSTTLASVSPPSSLIAGSLPHCFSSLGNGLPLSRYKKSGLPSEPPCPRRLGCIRNASHTLNRPPFLLSVLAHSPVRGNPTALSFDSERQLQASPAVNFYRTGLSASNVDPSRSWRYFFVLVSPTGADDREASCHLKTFVLVRRQRCSDAPSSLVSRPPLEEAVVLITCRTPQNGDSTSNPKDALP